MRTPRILSLVAFLALALAGGLLTAAPASAATGDTTLAGDRQFAKAMYYDGIGPTADNQKPAADLAGYAGTLTVSDTGTPIDGATVTLQRQVDGEADFTDIDTGTTDANGQAVFFTRPVGNATYRVAFAGDGTNNASVSQGLRLSVMRDFNATVAKPTKSTIFLKGKVKPGWGRKVVQFQKKACASCGWKTVSKKQTRATGKFSFQAAYPPLGKSWRFRAVIPAQGNFVKSMSLTLITKTVRA